MSDILVTILLASLCGLVIGVGYLMENNKRKKRDQGLEIALLRAREIIQSLEDSRTHYRNHYNNQEKMRVKQSVNWKEEGF